MGLKVLEFGRKISNIQYVYKTKYIRGFDLTLAYTNPTG